MSEVIAHFKYLEQVALSLLWGKPLPQAPKLREFYMELNGFVEPKERNRTGRGGHHYTPTDTRRFESSVKEAAATQMRELKLAVIEQPVIVHLEVRDQIHSNTPDWQRRLMEERLVFASTGGDLDNKEKAVLDGLNRVVYRDDRQVVQVYKYRSYAPLAGFKINVTPIGLTKADLAQIERLIKNAQKEGRG